MVGVEGLAGDDAPAVLDLVVGHVIDAGVAGHVALPLVVELNLAEDLRGGLELVRREVLLAHHQHMMFGEGAAQAGAGIGVDRRREGGGGAPEPGGSRQRAGGPCSPSKTLPAPGSATL